MLAFSEQLEQYEGNLAGFLNEYMLAATKASSGRLQSYRQALEKATALAGMVLQHMSGGKKSLTFVEGILVGVLANLDRTPEPSSADAEAWSEARSTRFQQLPAFDVGARYALSKAATVKERLHQAIGAFA